MKIISKITVEIVYNDLSKTIFNEYQSEKWFKLIREYGWYAFFGSFINFLRHLHNKNKINSFYKSYLSIKNENNS